MEQSLFKQPHLKTSFHDNQLVVRDRQKMMPCIAKQPFFLII